MGIALSEMDRRVEEIFRHVSRELRYLPMNSVKDRMREAVRILHELGSRSRFFIDDVAENNPDATQLLYRVDGFVIVQFYDDPDKYLVVCCEHGMETCNEVVEDMRKLSEVFDRSLIPDEVLLAYSEHLRSPSTVVELW